MEESEKTSEHSKKIQNKQLLLVNVKTGQQIIVTENTHLGHAEFPVHLSPRELPEVFQQPITFTVFVLHGTIVVLDSLYQNCHSRSPHTNIARSSIQSTVD